MKSVMVSMPGGQAGVSRAPPAAPPTSPQAPRPARSPTKLCFLLSHSGAARTPLVTSAKKAFFTCRGGRHGGGRGTLRQPSLPVPGRKTLMGAEKQPQTRSRPTCREVSKTTSLELVGMRS